MKEILQGTSVKDLLLLIFLAAIPLLLGCGKGLERIKKILVGKLEQYQLEKISKSPPPPSDEIVIANDGTSISNGEIEVSSIYVHPVKSLRAVSVNSARFNYLGLEGDRTLMIVRQTSSGYRFLTQRQCPALATVNASLPTFVNTKTSDNDFDEPSTSTTRTVIQLSDSTHQSKIFVDITPNTLLTNPVRYHAGLWDETVEVVDVGDKAASFIQSILSNSNQDDGDDNYDDVRVVAQLPKPQRRVDGRYCPAATVDIMGRSPTVSLTDGFPILIASEESLEELNRRLRQKGKDTIPMSRFRPNIVVKGLKEAFGEDHWKAIQIGGEKGPILHVVKGCPRCKQSCTDQLTGERFDEPLATLKDFRALNVKNKEDVYFAQNVVLQPGSEWKEISVKDPVRVLTRGKPVWDIDTVQAE